MFANALGAIAIRSGAVPSGAQLDEQAKIWKKIHETDRVGRFSKGKSEGEQA